MAIKVLEVEGMTCGHCKSAVTNALTDLDGVNNVNVDLESGEVTVDFNDDLTNESAMTEAIEDQGYDVK